MTGIERLRKVAGLFSANGMQNMLANDLTDIADQIERELREERDRWDEELCESQMDKTRVMAVYLEMNRHVLGHEGAGDSPVAHWARELREALGGEKHDPSNDVSMSAYDLLPADDRDAIAWVRKNGGIGAVVTMVNTLGDTLKWIRERAGIGEDEVVDYDELLDALDRRLMPEGMEWPQYESGEMVQIGDDVVERWNRRAERTCRVVTKERRFSQRQTLVTKSCSSCGYVFGDEEVRPILPGLDETMVINEAVVPRYCPNCGARVVTGDDA